MTPPPDAAPSSRSSRKPSRIRPTADAPTPPTAGGHFKDDPYLLYKARNYLFERGCEALRCVEQYEREAAAPETKEGATSLELHFLDGHVEIGAIPAEPRLGLNGQTFERDEREWRVSGRRPLPKESGRGAELLVCYEIAS